MTVEINPYNQVLDNMRRSESLVVRYSNNEDSDALKAEIAAKIEDRTLRVIIYGAYNSGKSTLINVLLNDARARVGDIPTTERVDTYDWNGYRLLDTPGVNAPIEHEEVTADQLTRTNAVMLVVREGDQDAMDVYDRLFEMMKSEKALFIILNHQLGGAEEIALASSRIGDILLQRAAEYGIADENVHAVPIYAVNLFTAMTGRVRGHDGLLEHSGFTLFVDAFADWTRRYDSKHHHLAEIKALVLSLWYAPAIDRLQGLTEAGDGGDAEQLRELERTLVAQKTRLHSAAYIKVVSEVSEIRPDIGEIMRSAASKEEAEQRLNGVLRSLLEKIDRWLREGLNGDNASMTARVEAPQMSEGRNTVTAEIDTEVHGKVRDDLLGRVSNVVTNKEIVKEALLAGRGMKAFGIRDITGLKGRWTSTLDKWAGGFTKVARGGLVVLQVGIAAWDSKRAHDRQERENREIRRQEVEHQKATELICGDLQRDLVRAVDDILEDTVGADIEGVRARLADITKDLSEKEQHYQELLDHRSQLEEIRFTSTKTTTPTGSSALGE